MPFKDGKPRPRQAFTAPKDKRTKDIIRHNSTTSPLLRLPAEVRCNIWGYLIGHRLIHVKQYRNRAQDVFHTVCQSPITEREAYELSKSEEYEKSTSLMKAVPGHDLRFCGSRHAACYDALHDATRESLPVHGLDIRILRVCRQVYVEANVTLWSTNVWSIPDVASLVWLRARNALQRRLIHKLHLGTNCFNGHLPDRLKMQYKTLDELHIDVEAQLSPLRILSRTFPARNIMVICSGSRLDVGSQDTREYAEGNGTTTWEERVASGEAFRTCFLLVDQAARYAEEKKKQRRLSEQQSRERGEVQGEEESDGEKQPDEEQPDEEQPEEQPDEEKQPRGQRKKSLKSSHKKTNKNQSSTKGSKASV